MKTFELKKSADDRFTLKKEHGIFGRGVPFVTGASISRGAALEIVQESNNQSQPPKRC
jgi:hypothetical protein